MAAIPNAVVCWNIRQATAFLLSFLLQLLSAINLGAQEETTFHSGVNLVLADVSVTDDKGSPVGALSRDQFQLKENGKDRPLVRFEEGSANISLVLVVDYSGSMRRRQESVIRGVDALVGQLRMGDEAALISFNEQIQELTGFRKNFRGDEWTSPLTRQVPAGQTALYDAVLAASRMLEGSAHERRVIVVLSDGEDTASKTSREELIDSLRSSNVLLYAVGLFEPGEPDSNSSTLKKLAEITGGTTAFDPDGMQLPRTFTAIMSDLRARYLLGFYADTPAAGKAEVRRLTILAHTPSGKSLRVRARREYRIGAR